MPPQTESEDHIVDSTDMRSPSEIEMDALDATPQAIRRGRLVVGIIIILALIAVAVIIIEPPLSWKPAHKRSNNYQLPPPAEIISQGNQPYIELRYAPVINPHLYHLNIQQLNHYQCHDNPNNACSTKVTLKTDVLMEHPKRHHTERDIFFSLKNVDIHVFDNDREVSLASVDDMLGNNKGDNKKGVPVFSILDDIRGMGTIVTEENVNPQITRVLFILADGIRMIYQPLPETAVGTDATWNIKGLVNDSKPSNEQWNENTHVQMKMDGENITLESSISLKSPHEQDIGKGNALVMMKNGIIMHADVNLTRTSNSIEGASNISEISIHWENAE